MDILLILEYVHSYFTFRIKEVFTLSTFTTNSLNILPGGEEYKYLLETFNNMKSAPNYLEMNAQLDTIKRILNRCFDMEVTMSVLDSSRDIYFFGFNIFPDPNACRDLIDMIIDTGNKNLDEVRNEWKANTKWHIDIDIKMIKDISRSLNAQEIIALLYYEIERICFSFDIIETVYLATRKSLIHIPYVAKQISKSSLCRNMYIIPFLRACSYVNFSTKVNEDSIVGRSDKMHAIYLDAINNLIRYYGTTNLIDRNPQELVNDIKYNLIWVFESVNDIKYRMGLLKKNIREQIDSEQSFFIKNIMITLYKKFSTYDNSDLVTESAYKGNNVSPELIAMEEARMENRFIEKVEAIKESSYMDFYDRSGKIKMVTQEEINLLNIEVGRINSIEDKLYCLQRCAELMELINYALENLNDPNTSLRVRESEHKLNVKLSQIRYIKERARVTPIIDTRYEDLGLDEISEYKG